MGLIVVQARTGSLRLPGKVLAELGGAPLLARLLRRLRGSTLLSSVLVATTELVEDDPVAELARAEGALVFRGHPTDVLQRFCDALAAHGEAGLVARVSADSPFLDAAAVDAVAAAYEGAGADIVQNHREPGWPLGTAVEVFERGCVDRLGALATEPAVREHVTLYAYEHPEAFTTAWVPPPAGLRAPELSLVVDTPEDLEWARRIQAQVASGDGGEASLAAVVAAAAGGGA